MTSSEGRTGCVFCCLGAVSEGSQLPGTDVVIVYLDDKLIGLIPAEHSGVLLAPREHTEGLSGTPEESAFILAALRQLVKQVKSFYGVEEATIEPITDSPGASGHALYRVLPVLSGNEEVRSDMETLAAELVETLRQHAASPRH